MSYGLEIYDSSGVKTFSADSRIARLIYRRTVTSSGSVTLQLDGIVSAQWMETDGFIFDQYYGYPDASRAGNIISWIVPQDPNRPISAILYVFAYT